MVNHSAFGSGRVVIIIVMIIVIIIFVNITITIKVVNMTCLVISFLQRPTQSLEIVVTIKKEAIINLSNVHLFKSKIILILWLATNQYNHCHQEQSTWAFNGIQFPNLCNIRAKTKIDICNISAKTWIKCQLYVTTIVKMLWFTCFIIFMCFDFDVFFYFHAVSQCSNAKIFPWLSQELKSYLWFFFISVWTPNDWFQKPLRCSKIHSFYLWHTYMLQRLVCIWLRSFRFSNLNQLLNYQTYLGDLDWLCLVVFDRLHFLPSFPMSLGKEPFFPRWPPFLPLDCLTG